MLFPQFNIIFTCIPHLFHGINHFFQPIEIRIRNLKWGLGRGRGQAAGEKQYILPQYLLVSVDWWEGIPSKGEGGKIMEFEQRINVFMRKKKGSR